MGFKQLDSLIREMQSLFTYIPFYIGSNIFLNWNIGWTEWQCLALGVLNTFWHQQSCGPKICFILKIIRIFFALFLSKT